MTLPFDPASISAGATPALFKTNARNQWEQVANAAFGATTVTVQVTSFSSFTVSETPLDRTMGSYKFKELRTVTGGLSLSRRRASCYREESSQSCGISARPTLIQPSCSSTAPS